MGRDAEVRALGRALLAGMLVVTCSCSSNVAAERDNDAGKVSRNSVLRYDTSASGTTLTATHEWNLTKLLPAAQPNLGFEAIAFVPDDDLVGAAFVDEHTGQPYDPASYLDHGGGLFLVAIENQREIYAFALGHGSGTATLIASFDSGQAGVMSLELDRENHYLWSYCDSACGNHATVLELDSNAASPTHGKFVVTHGYGPPSGLGNLNNEGITIGSSAECVGGEKLFLWADDGATNGHALRAGTIPCGHAL